ncbi:MAG: Fic family protein [Bdellovibrionota bacterium]
MAIEFMPSTISIDAEVLQLLEAISRKQGELSAHQHSIRDQQEIETIATIDAVHFSTKIEGNHLSRDQVTQALKTKEPKSPNHDLREVLNYSRARTLAREWVSKKKPFDDEWVLSLHKELLHGIVNGKLRGHYREAQCVIQDSKSRAIVYMAADAKDVPLLMNGLLTWLRRQRVLSASPLLLAAQFHFELVTIHPFMDGNGRIARLLTNGILLSGAHDIEHFAALEKQHEKDRAAYYRALRSLQAQNYYDIPHHQDIHSWVTHWLKCLLATYEEALIRVSGAKPISPSNHPPSIADRLEKAASVFRRHSKLRASEYADLMGLARTQAVADLNRLVEAGTLVRVGGGRSTVYKVKGDK